ncbi:hypothetical protein FACS1894195_5150 [Bacteroidia bacterium]|nr:hypothetical protein FACS1894195_5150 [Bacteroidia bacterium]
METNVQIFSNPQFGEIRTAGTSDNPKLNLGLARLDCDDVQLIDLHALNSNAGKIRWVITNEVSTPIVEKKVSHFATCRIS